jgi:photosystem II stability/assembly factor-like uncharacterized protein
MMPLRYFRFQALFLLNFLFVTASMAQWEPLPGPAPKQILALSESNGRLLAFDGNGQLYFSDNKGSLWQPADASPAPSNPITYYKTSVVYCNQGLYAFAPKTNFYRSVDNGSSWQYVNIPNSIFSNATDMVADSSVLWFFAWNKIWRYDPGTNSSTLIWDDAGHTILEMALTGSSVYALMTDGVYQYNQASSFTKLLDTPTGADLYTLAARGDTIWTMADSILYRSDNQGASWTQLGSYPKIGYLQYAKNRLYALNQQYMPARGEGVYASSNGGVSWSELYHPEHPLQAISLSVQDDQTTIGTNQGVLVQPKDSSYWVLRLQGFNYSSGLDRFEGSKDLLIARRFEYSTCFSFDHADSWVAMPNINSFETAVQKGDYWYGIGWNVQNGVYKSDIYRIRKGV